MNVALSTLSGISYGGVTYFENLLPALAEVDAVNEYHIYVAKNSPLTALVSQDNFFFHECRGGNNSSLRRFVWEQCVLPRILRKDGIDVMFTGKNLDIFTASCRTVISIRNVEPFSYTQYRNHWKLNISSRLRRALTRLSINSSDWVVAVSQSTRDVIANLSRKATGKIDVIYNGNSVQEGPQSSKSSHGVDDFILTSSKFVAYANQSSLIEAYALLKRRKPDIPPLWIAGGILDKDYFKHVKERIQEYGLEDSIKILGFVPHDRLIELYSQALVFLFPSTLEACPQTLIEAMACGVPIAASNVPPMPEICENAAIYFEPYNVDDIAEKIDRLISDESLRNELGRKSLNRADHFSWRKTAEEMVRVFEKVCRCDLQPARV